MTTKYVVNFGHAETAERIAAFDDLRANGYRPEVDGNRVVFHADALIFIREHWTSDDDGYIDTHEGRLTMWVDSWPYPIEPCA